MKTALVLGGTGLTGMYVLQQLIADDDYAQIIILTRRSVSPKSEKIINITTDFNDLSFLESIPKIDTIFSCLGTTRKLTPDLNQYRKIEIGIPYKVIQFCLNNKKELQNVHFISAIGADVDAKNFYLNIKGEAELCLQLLDIPHLFIYRPSLILGNRKESRLGEDVGQFLAPIINTVLRGKLTKYKAMPAKDIARAMVVNDKRTDMPNLSYYYVDTMLNVLKFLPHE